MSHESSKGRGRSSGRMVARGHTFQKKRQNICDVEVQRRCFACRAFTPDIFPKTSYFWILIRSSQESQGHDLHHPRANIVSHRQFIYTVIFRMAECFREAWHISCRKTDDNFRAPVLEKRCCGCKCQGSTTIHTHVLHLARAYKISAMLSPDIRLQNPVLRRSDS